MITDNHILKISDYNRNFKDIINCYSVNDLNIHIYMNIYVERLEPD